MKGFSGFSPRSVPALYNRKTGLNLRSRCLSKPGTRSSHPKPFHFLRFATDSFSEPYSLNRLFCHACTHALCQSNFSPVSHMRCSITESLRATATLALPTPFFSCNCKPQRFKAQSFLVFVSKQCADSTRSHRNNLSPSLVIRPK